jgi:nicotinamidase-related amidase
MDRRAAFEEALALVPGHTALLVVDMQRAFLDPGEAMEVPPARDIVPRVQELLGIFREQGLPVAFTEFLYAETAPLLVGALHPEHRRAAAGAPRGFGMPSSSCLAGETNVCTVPELEPRADELVVRKHYYDGFNGTVLDRALRRESATRITGP